MTTCDGNEATAYIAYKTNEVMGIFPITPSSPMPEYADKWSAEGRTNIWGNIPVLAEMQSEGGAAGTVHGSLQTGALTTTFTASQGLLLMIPNMYKIAGELTSTVFHVAARSLAAQGLSIFGDHQDVMAVRWTGFAQLASSSVQEAHDMALVAQAATLGSRIPFLHFFDGFRTSHEISKIELLGDEVIRAMIDDDLVRAHRNRALNPDNPFIRGTAQNPDVYFQGRETVNPFYAKVPGIVQQSLDKLASLTGRQYQLFEYTGAEDAERVVIIMGSAYETVTKTVQHLCSKGEKVGVINVRLFRPFSAEHLVAALPKTVKRIAVMDRTKEAGSNGEPLYQDVVNVVFQAVSDGELENLPKICGGRYGLSSKEFTPAMVNGIFSELARDNPKKHFTVGITDDLSNTSIDYQEDWIIHAQDETRAMFFGLGSDGTVGANKNTIKIIGTETDNHAQGYFVYDSKKAGSVTVSHLRFGPKPVKSPYLIQSADFIGCHQFNFVHNEHLVERAAKGATLLLNSHYGPEDVWDELPAHLQQALIDKEMKLYVIDAYDVAKKAGMGRRINTVMQTCFFALSGVIDKDLAIAKIKQAIDKTYARKGEEIVRMNYAAVDSALAHLHPVELPKRVSNQHQEKQLIPDSAPVFVREVTSSMLAGLGDRIPVSELPADGTFPSATTRYEKRNIALEIPVWEEDACVQCGQCSYVCPHAAIRAKFYHQENLDQAPDAFKSAMVAARGFPETRYTIQVFPEDCTGCTLCVDACPQQHPDKPGMKALNMAPKDPILEQEIESLEFFLTLPYPNRSRVDFSNVRGIQFLEPLFEFSGACSGCGEAVYPRLLSQLFGDRLMVANATGCSSIYGGNLPTTPWAKNAEGRGPAWSNSLFEDNAEFGFGFRLAADKQREIALQLLEKLKPELSAERVENLIQAPQRTESELQRQHMRVAKLKNKLKEIDTEDARNLAAIADQLVRRAIWIIGGDGWAYDIGSSGVDHVLASGKNLNVLVMDTEVYSNTGGQMSKSTPTGAIAKFAAAGKHGLKKDVALQAISYGNVYVARVAQSNPQQLLLAMREAEAYEGPAIIIAYSPCIEHGINMQNSLSQQQLAVHTGYWPLFRYNPELTKTGQNPFSLDSLRPSRPLTDFTNNEVRFKALAKSNPAEAKELMAQAQEGINRKWAIYEELATRNASEFNPHLGDVTH
nr:pyruvate:ferredoxin (flavodoxin) oxidoreductase [Dongshaea marina]